MAYYMNKSVPAKRGDIFYISNFKCYATDPSNAEGRPAIVVSSDKLNEHADVVEVVYLTTKEKRLMQRCCARFLQPLCVRPSTRSIRTGWAISSVPVPIRKWRVSMLGILCSLGIAAPVVDGEPVDNSVTVERNLYKHLYEDLLNKVMAR